MTYVIQLTRNNEILFGYRDRISAWVATSSQKKATTYKTKKGVWRAIQNGSNHFALYGSACWHDLFQKRGYEVNVVNIDQDPSEVLIVEAVEQPVTKLLKAETDLQKEQQPEVLEQLTAPIVPQDLETITESVAKSAIDYVVAVYHSYSCPNRTNDEPEYFTLNKWRETVGQSDQLTAETYGCITSYNTMLERMTITAICCNLPEAIKQLPQPELTKTATKIASKSQEFTGTVTEARLVEATVYDIDYSAKERHAKTLKVTLQTKDGQMVQFYSPSVQITINCPAGCPIAVVICEENDWIKKVQRQGEYKVVGENLESRLKLGDLVTVSGRIKASYNSGKSVTINHLKLIELTPFGGQLPQKEYAYNSGLAIISLPTMLKVSAYAPSIRLIVGLAF